MISLSLTNLILGLIASAASGSVLTAAALAVVRRSIASEAAYIRQRALDAEEALAWTRQVPDEQSTVKRRRLASGAQDSVSAAAVLARLGMERASWNRPTGKQMAVTR